MLEGWKYSVWKCFYQTLAEYMMLVSQVEIYIYIWQQYFKGTSDGEYRGNCWWERVYVRYFVCARPVMSLKGVTAVERACVCVCVGVGEALESLGVIGVRGVCVSASLCRNRPTKQLNPTTSPPMLSPSNPLYPTSSSWHHKGFCGFTAPIKHPQSILLL